MTVQRGAHSSPVDDLASAAASASAARADVAYRAWKRHVDLCQAECRTEGRDCKDAEILRGVLREARGVTP